jgi:Ulp1 family protease
MTVDDRFVPDLKNTVLPQSSGALYATRMLGGFYFEASDLRRLDSRQALLNDICVNGIAKLLQEIYVRDPAHCHQSKRCAIFSTHDLVRIRYKASDKDLWRAVSKTDFWAKSLWIFPIHRPRECHWVLAVVHIQEAKILLYDSFAIKRNWAKDLEV